MFDASFMILLAFLIVQILASDNSSSGTFLKQPHYLYPSTIPETTFTVIKFLSVGSFILYPNIYLENLKFNLVAIFGLILAIDHFGIVSKLISSLNQSTVTSVTSNFIFYSLILVLVILNLGSKHIRVMTSSLGGGYVGGYIVGLLLSFTSKIEFFVLIIGFFAIYLALHFLAKNLRKGLLYSTFSGWSFFCCADIVCSNQLINSLYSKNEYDHRQGSLVLIGILSTCMVLFIILRLKKYIKDRSKKQKKNKK
ncbi:hypothetical protein NUSPORA_00476 [Nucleospora cyclopteri]